MLLNQTQNKIISRREMICTTSLSQALGLMFRKKQNLVMIFRKERKISLHNFFVFYPIDVLVLNENKEIVEIKRNFKPFTFWNSTQKGKYVIELAFSGEYLLGEKISFTDQRRLNANQLKRI